MTPNSLSLPRLIRHDLTISWRRLCGFLRARTTIRAVIVLALASALLHLAAWPLAAGLLSLEVRDGAVALDGMGFVIVLPWLLSQGLTGATRALYSRGDLDLLLSAPLSPQKFSPRAPALSRSKASARSACFCCRWSTWRRCSAACAGWRSIRRWLRPC